VSGIESSAAVDSSNGILGSAGVVASNGVSKVVSRRLPPRVAA